MNERPMITDEYKDFGVRLGAFLTMLGGAVITIFLIMLLGWCFWQGIKRAEAQNTGIINLPGSGGSRPLNIVALPPFDVKAKEWDGPGTHAANACGPPNGDGTVDCNTVYIAELDHHISCEDKKRVLLTDEEGKHHCYAFYSLGDQDSGGRSK